MSSSEMLYTIEEVSKMLRVTQATVWRWIKQGKLKAVILPSGRLRIPASELEKIISQVKEAARE